MPPRRLVVAAVTAVAAGLPAAASAAPVCNLLTDKASDAYVGPRDAAAGNTPPLDIRSFDVGTGKKTLVAVLRLASTKASDSHLMAAGYIWTVEFHIARTPHRFTRTVTYDGRVVDRAYANGQPIPVFTVRLSPTSITWTVPREHLPKLAGKRAVIDNLYARTTTTGALAYDNAPDNGTPAKTKYVDRTPSCVRPA